MQLMETFLKVSPREAFKFPGQEGCWMTPGARGSSKKGSRQLPSKV